MKFAYFRHFCYHLNKGVSVPIYVIVKGFAAMKRLSRHTVDFVISAGAACRYTLHETCFNVVPFFNRHSSKT